MKVLVTGGRGYIGTNLCLYLEMLGYETLSYDIVSRTSILDRRLLQETAHIVDAIVHLAAIAGVAQCEADPNAAYKTNVNGTLGVLEAATKGGVGRVILASSAAAGPRTTVYGETKALAEKACFDWHNLLKGNAYVLRFANVYGGFAFLRHKQGAIASFLRVLRDGGVATVTGRGLQERDFIHVWEVCRAIEFALHSNYIPTQPIDICSGKVRTIRDVVTMFGIPFKYVSGTAMDLREFVPPDPTLAEDALAFFATDRLPRDIRKWKREQQKLSENPDVL